MKQLYMYNTPQILAQHSKLFFHGMTESYESKSEKNFISGSPVNVFASGNFKLKSQAQIKYIASAAT